MAPTWLNSPIHGVKRENNHEKKPSDWRLAHFQTCFFLWLVVSFTYNCYIYIYINNRYNHLYIHTYKYIYIYIYTHVYACINSSTIRCHDSILMKHPQKLGVKNRPKNYPLVMTSITHYGKSQFLMGQLTISMATFNSYVTNYQRVGHSEKKRLPLFWWCYKYR